MTAEHAQVVVTYRQSMSSLIGNSLAGWLAADMHALCDLVDATEAQVIGDHDEVWSATQRLLQALETVVAAVEHHRGTRR